MIIYVGILCCYIATIAIWMDNEKELGEKFRNGIGFVLFHRGAILCRVLRH